jgi:hypothetical protein
VAERPIALPPVNERRRSPMVPISPYIEDQLAFDPADLKAMSMAFDRMCATLKLNHDARARETVAARIIELARRGEHSPTKLRDPKRLAVRPRRDPLGLDAAGGSLISY